MTAPADRIGYDTLTALVNARPDPGTRRALYAALTGINDAERTMREKTASLRSALDDAGACPGATRMRADSYRIRDAATELDRASTARDLHWATAAALLAYDELSELTSATPAPGAEKKGHAPVNLKDDNPGMAPASEWLAWRAANGQDGRRP